MTLAYIFPGQGSQYPGMGKNLVENFPVAARIFEELDDALHFSISRLCFEGSAEDLQLTENTQPAILAVSAAVLAHDGVGRFSEAGLCCRTQPGRVFGVVGRAFVVAG